MAGAIHRWGTTGAAVVFAARALVDAAVLFGLAGREMKRRRPVEGSAA